MVPADVTSWGVRVRGQLRDVAVVKLAEGRVGSRGKAGVCGREAKQMRMRSIGGGREGLC